jgi:hypothetical protein
MMITMQLDSCNRVFAWRSYTYCFPIYYSMHEKNHTVKYDALLRCNNILFILGSRRTERKRVRNGFFVFIRLFRTRFCSFRLELGHDFVCTWKPLLFFELYSLILLFCINTYPINQWWLSQNRLLDFNRMLITVLS